MAGLVAVVAHDRERRLPAEEMRAFVRAYERLRGPGVQRSESVADWAQAVVVDERPSGARAGGSDGWTLAVGAFHDETGSGDAAPLDLDGQFALVRHDPARDLLEIFNDALGMQALYLAEHQGSSYISTSATAIAAHLGRAADPVGAGLFLRTGNQFGPVTHWQGVERLEPATMLMFAPDGRRRSAYWTPPVDERVRAMDFRRTVDHCAEVVTATFERRLRGAACLSADLTGGYDSRLAAVILKRAGLDFRAVTSGEAETVDVRLAREVARAGGLEWRQQRLPVGWQADAEALDHALGWGDGTLEVLQLAEVLWRQGERAQRCPVIVAGGGGEHFGPYPWLQEFAHAGRSTRIDYDRLMRMRVLAPVNLSMLRRAARGDEVEDYCRTVLAQRVELYAGELNTTQLDLIYAYKCMGHFGAYRSASEARVRQELPFYYRDVFCAAFSSHHRWRNAHRLHRALVERLHPAMASIDTERGGPAELVRPGNAPRFAPYYGRLARTAVRKTLRRPAPATPLPEPVRAAYSGAVAQLRARGVLALGTMRSAGLYDAAGFDALVAGSAAPGFRDWSMLGRIATLELALRSVEGATL